MAAKKRQITPLNPGRELNGGGIANRPLFPCLEVESHHHRPARRRTAEAMPGKMLVRLSLPWKVLLPRNMSF
jgi:hypothetical protein